MKLDDLKKVMSDSTPAVDVTPETLRQLEPDEQTETTTTNAAPVSGQPEQDEQRFVNLANFCATATGLYCAISDFVYKKVKKTETAPEWSPEVREQLTNACNDFLEGYNIPMSPAVELVITLVTVEVMRYTLLSPKKTETNED